MEALKMKNETSYYIARYPCGCIYAAIVDDPKIKGHHRRVAKFIEVKFGATIERVTNEYIRQTDEWCFNCTHGNNPEH